MKTTYVDGCRRTFTEATPGQLTGKETYLVELTSAGKVQLATTGLAIGVMEGRLEGSTDEVTIRLLGKGGTVRMKQNGAVTPGARVKQLDNDGRVQPIGASGRSLGIKLSPGGTGAANDIIEVLDLVEVIA